MSYILDALRRADSERERGSVPSIHSPPAPQVADDPKPTAGHAKALVWVIVGLLLALAGLLAWHFFSGKDSARGAADQNAAQVAAPPVRQPPPMAQETPVSRQDQATAPSTQLEHEPAPATQAPPRQMAPRQQAVQQTSPQPAQFQQRPPAPQSPYQQPPVLSVPERVKPSGSITAPITPATTPEADPRVYATSELPANIQRELPKLVVGGAMYSDTPANRMLIINSQVFHEGDKLAPDLVLQEIKLKSAVFKYKGYRYGVSY